MKSNKKRSIMIILIIAISIMCVSNVVAITATKYRQTIELDAKTTSIKSSNKAGNCAKGTVSNHRGSARSVTLKLQSNSGKSWKTLAVISANPGVNKTTASWGRSDTDYLFRINLSVTNPPLIGTPGCIAVGKIYTN
ncbi:hypothetical protein P261_02908 [Lachnospiraceae bacterium TWA4]|nr:hypothetical protein P261_02908 [Lachnospiraceae bacterium TWA4]